MIPRLGRFSRLKVTVSPICKAQVVAHCMLKPLEGYAGCCITSPASAGVHHHCTKDLRTAQRVLCGSKHHVTCLEHIARAGYYCNLGLNHQQVGHTTPCCSKAVLEAQEVQSGSTLGGVTILICTRRSSRATMGWKQSGHGEALRRFSPP